MDLSALIFVALAVAWAVYLVPKALRHHEDDAVSRSIDGFSDRLRVLARREAVSATKAELVTAGRPRSEVEEQPATPTPAPRAQTTDATDATDEVPATVASVEDDAAVAELRRRRRARRAAARRAAERRRRVLSLLLLAVVLVGALAIGKVVATAWIAAPALLLAAWLVACRLMVRAERAARAAAPVRKRRRTLADQLIAEEDAEPVPEVDLADTDSIPAVPAEAADEAVVDDPDRWAPVEVPLPTYVAKAPAGRSVRTIDLDSTGVWSSGRNEADSRLAREAEARRSEGEDGPDVEQHRAAGS